ncbi:MAG: hypothetical protein ABSG47_07815 [Terracidiphilus sp.]
MSCRVRSVMLFRSAALLSAATMFVLNASAARHKQAEDSPAPQTSQPPSYTISAATLGFAPPGEIYFEARYSLVSLDFLDEDRLLFTFRVPGLFHRDPSGTADEMERHVRAVVVHVPDGVVQAEALWTLHDYGRYVFMLEGGKFALRDRDTLSLGDGSLALKPWLKFPGPLNYVELDPSRQYVVAESTEAAGSHAKSGDVQSPPTAQTLINTDAAPSSRKQDTILRILRSPSGEVMLVSHVRAAVHVPFNAEGYLETLRSLGLSWIIQFDPFTGGATRAGVVDSVCAPRLDFVSPKEYAASVCASSGGPWFVVMTLDGRLLWQRQDSATNIWPLLVVSKNGTRLIRETVQATHAVNATAPLSPDDLIRQNVTVLDAATGKEFLRTQASPIYDAGGNVALSPSGRRVAILREGEIQIFDLPEAPPLPAEKP